jgi:uncharacterized protein
MVSDDLSLIVNHAKECEQKNKNLHLVHLQKSYNPVKALLFLTMYFYQKVLSEQISAGCEFERTCSGFSIAAIHEFGFLKGMCLSADRLTRCNGQAQIESEEYLINHANGKTIDEPFMYRFKD